MRRLLTYIMFFIYVLYLTASSFPLMGYYMYQKLLNSNQPNAETVFCSNKTDSDLDYLEAIKKRAGFETGQDKNLPQKTNVETVHPVGIITEQENKTLLLDHSLAQFQHYHDIYFENFPEVSVPPPKSV